MILELRFLPLTCLILTLSLVCLLAGCTGAARPAPTPTPEAITLKLNWLHGADFLGFYVAQSRGFYAAEGLAVTIEPLTDTTEGREIPNQVAGSEFNFGVGVQDLLRAQSEGRPLTAIANIYKFGPGAFFARADSGIVTPADLAGRRIVVKNEAWQGLLENLLAREGLTLADVETVPGGFDMTPFFEGEVEVWAGYLTDEVVRARQQGLNLVTWPVYEYDAAGKSFAVTIYTSQAMLENNPNRAERFLRASLRGWAWTIEHPTKAVDEMLTLFPDLAAERDFHLASFEAAIPLIIPPGTRLGDIDCPAWVANEMLANLETTEGLCATEVFEAVQVSSP